MSVFRPGGHSLCNSGSTARVSAVRAASMMSAACSNLSFDIRWRPSICHRSVAGQCLRSAHCFISCFISPALTPGSLGARVFQLHHPTPRECLRFLVGGIYAERRFDVAEEAEEIDCACQERESPS